MAVTSLPSFTRTIDNAFMETWYDIKPQAIDNILLATPVWAALKMRGRFTPQVGGTLITRSIRYAVGPPVVEVDKGDVLGEGEVETETMATWTFRKVSTHVQRSLWQDRENQGKYLIKSYVKKRLGEARDALAQDFETKLLRAISSTETGKGIQGLYDMIPVQASRAAGTYGKIARPTTYASDLPTVGNIWWSPNYKQLTAPIDINLESDMRSMYNQIYQNRIGAEPDLILTTQTMYETYEDFILDRTQIVKRGASDVADLGFETVKYKGADMVWSANVRTSDMFFLNTRSIEFVYDPTMWFDMTEFKYLPKQLESLAHILCAGNLISDQLRNHGLLYA